MGRKSRTLPLRRKEGDQRGISGHPQIFFFERLDPSKPDQSGIPFGLASVSLPPVAVPLCLLKKLPHVTDL